ncbi:MAG: glucosyltransferase domain-containing protein [Lachnospiraceae bacterium]|nr:glucosyltransferase domain-containing protein [Lachnospiraceae bacterium]
MILISELLEKGKIQFQEMKRELLAVAFCSFIVYLPFMSGQLNNADGFIFGVFMHNDFGHEDGEGRFFLRFFNFWRDGMVLPAMIIGLCLLLLWIMAAVLWYTLDIHGSLVRILSGIIIVCTPSMADMFTYYYTADGYCMSLLLAVLAAAFLIKGEKKVSFLGAILSIIGSLGIYQAYLGITVIICGFWLLRQTIDKNVEDRLLWKSAIRLITGGMAGVLAYYLLFSVLDKIGYLAIDNERIADSPISNLFANLLGGIKEIYQVFAEYFFKDTLIYNAWHGRRYVNMVVCALILFMIGMAIWKNKTYKNWIRCGLSVVLTLLIPVMLEIVILVTPGISVHAETGILMLCGMNFFYLLPILLLPLLKGQKWIYAGTNVMVKLTLIYMSVFMCMFIGVFERMVQTEHTKFGTLAVRLESRIEELDDYSSGIKVLVVGRPQSGNYPFVDDTYKTVTKGMISDYSLVFGRADQVSMSWIELFRYYCGVRYVRVSEEQRLELMESPEFAQMENYPAETSVRWIDDVVVIKLSEYVK